MKKFIILLVVFCSIALISCSPEMRVKTISRNHPGTPGEGGDIDVAEWSAMMVVANYFNLTLDGASFELKTIPVGGSSDYKEVKEGGSHPWSFSMSIMGDVENDNGVAKKTFDSGWFGSKQYTLDFDQAWDLGEHADIGLAIHEDK